MYKIYYLTSVLDCFQPRYVGYSKNENERLYHHISESKNLKVKSHKTKWIKRLLNHETTPLIVVIDFANSEDEACDIERFYIESFKIWYKLTNSTNGGEKSKAIHISVRKKISDGIKEFYKENTSWNKGLRYKMDEEVKIKRRIGIGDKLDGENNHFYGKKHSEYTRKLLSSKNRQYEYDYNLFYEYYIVKNMDRNEMSEATGLPSVFIGKMIYKYKLTPIKKKIYGKIKGKKIYIDDQELLYRYYDHDRF